MSTFRRCVGKLPSQTKGGLPRKCPLDARTYSSDGQWRCPRCEAEFKAAHPDVSERESIQSEQPKDAA